MPHALNKPAFNRLLLGAGAVLLTALVGWLGVAAPGAAPPLSSRDAVSAGVAELARVQTASRNLTAQPLVSLPDPGPLPASLRGASPDVRLRTDAHGNLIAHADSLHLFEFYLSALLEEPLETCLNRISRALGAQLQGTALAQARDLLRRYLEYKVALTGLEQRALNPGGSDDYDLNAIDARQQQLQALRLSHFSEEENRAFFSQEQQYDTYMRQALALNQAKGLEPGQREQALADLEQQLPEPMRQARREVTRQTQLYEDSEALKRQGASAEQLYRLRAQALTPAAASALAELDQRQAQWQMRVEGFRQARAELAGSGLSAVDQRTALEQLIERDFTAQEQRQIRTLARYPNP
ncbi:MAG: lipase secretion chaperone [Pseudomonas sp.]|uniref:lipase secretion chaperone n=1 Tax=Pseudomonas sp. TaxID=306 RepID=UPI003398C179